MWWEPEHKYLPRKVINRSKCGILRKHPQKICSERNLASGNNKKCGQNKQERSVLKHPHSEAGGMLCCNCTMALLLFKCILQQSCKFYVMEHEYLK